MTIYRGLEKVDPTLLGAQRTLTEALWVLLTKQGVRRGAMGRIESFFFADDEAASSPLTAAFKRSAGWQQEVGRTDDARGRIRIKIVSPEVVFS
jgi:hypothetical protein